MAYINLLQVIYPVGSMYFSCSATSPSFIIGGTWSQITGAVLRLNGSGVGGYSSSDTHTLTINEMPSHRHIDDECWDWICSQGFNTGVYNIDSVSNWGNAQTSSNNTTMNQGGGKRFQSCHEPISSMLGDVLLKVFGGDIDGIR